MDRRYKSWLTPEGAKRIAQERDHILKVALPQLRESGANPKERIDLLRRVLYLNQLLNYNGNPKCSS
ncbi:hypothetical protein M5X00_17640 [Paenibacillus alvei]|uniref:hypothetical protein n=1 Tax=Paenibacillus alvei TaxID=44250 RepID=UPI000287DCCB|nr:hypothetical protein [Paenibacillus alvei]EJW16919.1 hypothetical protein PAV_5c05020 [Paenibacillus alvei DSM 29]EJW19916.1 hypothetical protein PAV_1c09040 [Paenibacillus alvei DSM 29]MCY9543263.1 hypothetical protein [Paenibacillus alvei]MCY9708480.1 hypothetical protein [Paenibacillus alvei]MCY9732203.1 hypothetical protein [Paenibacillus alvei]